MTPLSPICTKEKVRPSLYTLCHPLYRFAVLTIALLWAQTDPAAARHAVAALKRRGRRYLIQRAGNRRDPQGAARRI